VCLQPVASRAFRFFKAAFALNMTFTPISYVYVLTALRSKSTKSGHKTQYIRPGATTLDALRPPGLRRPIQVSLALRLLLGREFRPLLVLKDPAKTLIVQALLRRVGICSLLNSYLHRSFPHLPYVNIQVYRASRSKIVV
jgi:hypothetical protein